MMLPSHVLATVIAGFLLARFIRLDARSWFLAIAFGVLIDIDHLVEFPAYLATAYAERGIDALSPATVLAHGAAWQGFFHDPLVGSAIVLGSCIVFRSAIPLLFWGLHMILDFVVATRYVVFASPGEFAVDAVLAAGVASLLWFHHRHHGEGRPLSVWAQRSLRSVLAAGAAIVPGARNRQG